MPLNHEGRLRLMGVLLGKNIFTWMAFAFLNHEKAQSNLHQIEGLTLYSRGLFW